MFKWAIAFSAALSGCYGDPHSFAIEDTFTDEEVEVIKEAVAEWQLATDSSDADLIITEGLHRDEAFDLDKHWYGSTDHGTIYKIHDYEHGYYELRESMTGRDYDGAALSPDRILVVGNKSKRRLKQIILHELGHIYGIDHQDKGLMSSKPTQICIDTHTLIEFCEEWSCGPNAHGTCLVSD